MQVPGLLDNVDKGVRRGRMRISGDEVKRIFEPVVQVDSSQKKEAYRA